MSLLFQELTIIQLIEERRRQLLIHYRYVMLGFKLIGNEYWDREYFGMRNDVHHKR